MTPKEYREWITLAARSQASITATLIDAMGYPDEHVRLSRKYAQKAVAEMRKCADELAAKSAALEID